MRWLGSGPIGKPVTASTMTIGDLDHLWSDEMPGSARVFKKIYMFMGPRVEPFRTLRAAPQVTVARALSRDTMTFPMISQRGVTGMSSDQVRVFRLKLSGYRTAPEVGFQSDEAEESVGVSSSPPPARRWDGFQEGQP